MSDGEAPIEEALIQLIKDGKGDVAGLKELANKYNITVGELTEPIKKLSEKNMINVMVNAEGNYILTMREKTT